ncbi:type II toxin-antitoxin system VapC family toxin [Rubripirellula amarantea]|nr:type II toxin-antitoxin system VapC family toxin [Rubripirellula amarantea]
MIVLDTNVISEVMKPVPDPVVKDWLDAQVDETMWLTSVTVFEIACGVEQLPSGKRKTALVDAFNELIVKDFQNRVLAFDDQHARKAGELWAKLKSLGRVSEFRDIQIAGIVATFKATLATRNTRHFLDTGVKLIDPWNVTP